MQAKTSLFEVKLVWRSMVAMSLTVASPHQPLSGVACNRSGLTLVSNLEDWERIHERINEDSSDGILRDWQKITFTPNDCLTSRAHIFLDTPFPSLYLLYVSITNFIPKNWISLKQGISAKRTNTSSALCLLEWRRWYVFFWSVLLVTEPFHSSYYFPFHSMRFYLICFR